MRSLSDKEKALLNKIYRAVHDRVCPKCGHDMVHYPALGKAAGYECKNVQCAFYVSDVAMSRMRVVVQEWGAEAVSFFELWRSGALENTY